MKFFATLIFLFPIWVLGQQKNLIERVFEAQSKNKSPVSARQEMINHATTRVSEDLIKEIIGDNKFLRNKALIQSKIMKNSARFVPFAKPGNMEPLQPEGFKMAVTLKVSVDDLQSLLLENGLFYESDSTPVALPAIRIVDRVNSKTLAWWSDQDVSQKAFLLKVGRGLEESLKSSFSKHNFYLLQPQSLRFHNFLPSDAKVESLRSEDWQLISQRLGAQVLVDGEMVISKSQERSEANVITLRMTATQVMNSRVIAEVTRLYETEAGPFEQVTDRKLKEVLESTSQDLASQVLEAWQRGALGASLYRITVRGRLPLMQQEAFKEVLRNKVREVKNIRERLISTDSVTYEVDSAIGPRELTQKAPEFQLSGAKIVLESSSEKEAIYRVSR